jgi:hypothetical protein
MFRYPQERDTTQIHQTKAHGTKRQRAKQGQLRTQGLIMKTRIRLVASCAALLLIPMVQHPANAALVTDLSTFVNPTVIDFNQFNSYFTYTAGPLQVGNPPTTDVTYSSTSSNSVIGADQYGLSSNGTWNSNETGYVGVNSASDTITFTLNNGPVSNVGAFVNYAPGYGTPTITALGAGGAPIETYDLSVAAPISTPGGTDAGAFRGISRPTADITGFQITGGYMVADNLTYSGSNTAAVPEGGTLVLVLPVFGLAMSLAARRRAK